MSDSGLLFPGAGAVIKLKDLGDGTFALVTQDGGSAFSGTQTYTSSSDVSTAAAIGPVPTSGSKSQLLLLVASSSSTLELTFQQTSGSIVTAIFSVFLLANTPFVFAPPYKVNLPTADLAWQVKASASGQVRITTLTTSTV